MMLLDLVLDKKELRGIDRAFAKTVLDNWLAQNPSVKKEFEADEKRFVKKKSYQRLRSEVRQELRHVFGVFHHEVSSKKKQELVGAACKDPSEENVNLVLGLHRSSEERLPYYTFFYHQLFGITGQPKSVLDIGCGLNPFSAIYAPGVRWHCADVAPQDLKHIDAFLSAIKREHSIHAIDCTDIEAVKQLPRADIALCLKLFDTLEDVKRNVTKELLDAIPADIIIATFPTASIGQNTSIGPREWFSRLVTGRVLGEVTLPNEHIVIITTEQKVRVTQKQQ